MAGKPAEHMSSISALRQDVPDRFNFARRAGHRSHSTGLGIGLHKAEDAVLVWPFAGSNGVPQHRRENRTQGREISDDPMVDEIVERGHQPLVEERINQFPISSVPADQKNFSGERSTHKAECRSKKTGWQVYYR